MGDALHSNNTHRSRKAWFLSRPNTPKMHRSWTIALTTCRQWRSEMWQRGHQRQQSRTRARWREQRGRSGCTYLRVRSALGVLPRRRSSGTRMHQSRVPHACPVLKVSEMSLRV